jgi:hypothetical protein
LKYLTNLVFTHVILPVNPLDGVREVGSSQALYESPTCDCMEREKELVRMPAMELILTI